MYKLSVSFLIHYDFYTLNYDEQSKNMLDSYRDKNILGYS